MIEPWDHNVANKFHWVVSSQALEILHYLIATKSWIIKGNKCRWGEMECGEEVGPKEGSGDLLEE